MIRHPKDKASASMDCPLPSDDEGVMATLEIL
jgi:hypothetical protein